MTCTFLPKTQTNIPMRSTTESSVCNPHLAFMPVFLFRAKRISYLPLVAQLEPSGTNWIKTKEKFAFREKICKWKTGDREDGARNRIRIKDRKS